MVKLSPGIVVVIRAFDDVPEHLFKVDTVEEDRITGEALTGPFTGSYGEPPLDLVKGIAGKD